jgi:hypothetical protein
VPLVLEPVTAIWYRPELVTPVDDIVNVTVALPPGERETLVVLSETLGMFGRVGDIVNDSDTVCEQVPVPVMVIAVVLVKPAGLLMKLGFAVMLKSQVTVVTVTATVVDRGGRVPDVPVTVTWYVCVGVFDAAQTCNVDCAEPPLGTGTIAGLTVIARVGSLGTTVGVSCTVPWKPNRLDTVIMEVPHEPWPIVKAVGLAVSLKSTGVT